MQQINPCYSDTKNKTAQMVTHIKQVFAEAIQFNYTWLDEETREKALEKAIKSRDYLVYPEWIKQNSELDQYYNMENSTRARVKKGQYFEAFITKLQLKHEDAWKRFRESTNFTKLYKSQVLTRFD